MAEHLGEVEPIAMGLLDRFDAITINGRTNRLVLNAAKLWLCSGDTGRCVRLLSDLLVNNSRHTHRWMPRSGEMIDIAAVVDTFDSDTAARLIDQALAKLPLKTKGQQMISRSIRNSLVARVATALVGLDPERALAVARDMSDAPWRPRFGSDRASTLASLAHVHLDAGRVEVARELLAECLAELDRPVELESADPSPDAPFTVVATGERFVPDIRDSLQLMGYTTNTYSDWLHRCERRTVHVGPHPADHGRGGRAT